MATQPDTGSRVGDSVGRVRAALSAAGLTVDVRTFDASTRTAADAARAIGTSVPQIVKSLVFVVGDRPCVALVSGSNRLDVDALGRLGGGSARQATPEEVRAATGFAVGGVAPVGYADPLPVYVDRDLLQFDVVWAAAGTPNAVFPIAPADLVRVTQGSVADLAQQSGR